MRPVALPIVGSIAILAMPALAQPRPADPQLAREIATLVASYRSRLPIEQPNGILVTDIQARGTEVIYALRISADLDAAAEQRFRSQLPVQACRHPVPRGMFERGGIYTYRVTDAVGDTFTVSIDRC